MAVLDGMKSFGNLVLLNLISSVPFMYIAVPMFQILQSQLLTEIWQIPANSASLAILSNLITTLMHI